VHHFTTRHPTLWLQWVGPQLRLPVDLQLRPLLVQASAGCTELRHKVLGSESALTYIHKKLVSFCDEVKSLKLL